MSEVRERLDLPMKIRSDLRESFSRYLETDKRIQRRLKEHKIPIVRSAADPMIDPADIVCFVDEIVVSKLLVDAHDFILCHGNPWPFGFEHPEYLEISVTPMLLVDHDHYLDYYQIIDLRGFVLNVEPKRYGEV
jgi:hypothetical protein